MKAFEVEKGRLVYLSDEDFETAEAQTHGGRTIDIRVFVRYEEIDPIFFERTYYLGPAEGGERVYALLVRALDETGLAAVAKLVMRNRDTLACLRVRDGVLTLERMHLADEVRPADELKPEGVDVEEGELELAKRLIEEFSGDERPAVSWAGYVLRADFWEKTLQNWQSEFLAVGTMAVFTIYLRERGSPESKPVVAPHDQTGTSG